jgi:hypothetical protein
MPRRGEVSVRIAPKEAAQIGELLRDPANWAPEPSPETSLTRYGYPDPTEVEERCLRLALKFALYGRQRHKQTHLMSLRREDASWVASVAARARARRFEEWLTRARRRTSSQSPKATPNPWMEAAFARAGPRPPQGVQRAIMALAAAPRAGPGRPRLAPHTAEAISSGAYASSPRNVQRVRRMLKLKKASLADRLELTNVTSFRRR